MCNEKPEELYDSAIEYHERTGERSRARHLRAYYEAIERGDIPDPRENEEGE